MKQVLVTGAAGFIASEVCRQLLTSGVEVVGVDNMNDYYDVRLKHYRLETLTSFPNFKFVKMDIENRSEVSDLFDKYKFDVVFNLAARAGVRYSMENPYIYMTTNAMGSLNLLDVMKEKKVGKFVLASTSSLYAGQPMPFDENLPVNTPISPYAASKKAAEVMAYSYHYLYGIDVSIVRYFTVYGPCGRPDMSIFRFVQWITKGEKIELFGDGGQARDFTYVTDIARGTILASKNVGYEVINLGGGEKPTTINSIIHGIENRLGKKATIEGMDFHKADIKVTSANIDKAKNLLGWSSRVKLEQGLDETVKWHVDNQKWLTDVKL